MSKIRPMGSDMPRLTMLFAGIALLVGASGVSAAVPAKTGAPPTGLSSREAPAKFVPGEVVVQFRKGVSASARMSTLGALGARGTERIGDTGFLLVRLPQAASVTASVASLARDPRVAHVQPNYLSRISAVPNDPRWSQMWGLHQGNDHDIDAPEAWNTTTGSEDVIVAVIDTGVDIAHPDLVDNIWHNDADPVNGVDDDLNGYVDDTDGWDSFDDDRDPSDLNGHGTHVAGTIGAVGNNLTGLPGVNWDVSIMALRAGDPDGSLPNEDIAEAIAYACNNGAHIVNGSFGSQMHDPVISNAIRHSSCSQTLFVFAAGNDGFNLQGHTQNGKSYPCEYHRPPPQGISAPNVLCVGATTTTDAIAGFSNRGTAAVHLGAPGTSIVSTTPGYETIWSDNFDGTTTDFITNWGDKTTNNSQVWNRTTQHKTSGTHSLTDSPSANYFNQSNRSIARLPVFSLAGETGCRLDYRMRLQTEFGFDWFRIELEDGTFVYDFNGWSGSTGNSFAAMSDDLSDFDGEPTMSMRFWFESDVSFRFDGVYLDDVRVKCLQPGVPGYQFLQGTSMASPHVAGVAALLLAHDDTMTVNQLKQALLRGTDRKPGLASHFSTAGRLNARDSLTVLDDHTRPTTTITGKPSNKTKKRKATFRFRSNEPGGRFQCKHMNGPWRNCWSPAVYRNLDLGRHVFRVRAVDKNGNVDRTPAWDVWRVKRR